jgi:hypothetical protein
MSRPMFGIMSALWQSGPLLHLRTTILIPEFHLSNGVVDRVVGNPPALIADLVRCVDSLSDRAGIRTANFHQNVGVYCLSSSYNNAKQLCI